MIIFLVISISSIQAKFPASVFRSNKILDNGDTVIYERRHSDWWMGIDFGANVGLYFGSLNLPYDPMREIDKSNIMISYNMGSGAGIFGGINAEYLPVGKKLGASLKVHFLDYKPSTSSSDIINPNTNSKFNINFQYRYMNISPGICYNIFVPYLNFISGLDFDLMMSEKIKRNYFFENTGDIYHDSHLDKQSKSLRIGVYLGLSYDLFVADITNFGRAYLTPYFSFHGGTNIFNEYNSSRNMLLFRLGLNARLCLDMIKSSTIKYNMEEESGFNLLAQVSRRPIRFAGFKYANVPPAKELKMLPQKQIEVVTQELPAVESAVSVVPSIPLSDTTIATVASLTPNLTFKYQYTKPENTKLTKELREYLDYVADYLKENPRATVRIVGHSDNQGTLEQNTKRALDRAKQVVDYLVSKKIPRGRILDRGAGSLEPVASNLTASGRKLNRRVEIRIIQ